MLPHALRSLVLRRQKPRFSFTSGLLLKGESTNGSDNFSASETPGTQFLFCFVFCLPSDLELTWHSLLNHGFLAKTQTELLLAERCYSRTELSQNQSRGSTDMKAGGGRECGRAPAAPTATRAAQRESENEPEVRTRLGPAAAPSYRDLERAPPALPTARHRCRLPGRGREQSPARGRCPRRRRTVTAKRRTSARGARPSAYQPRGRRHATRAAEDEREKRGAVRKEGRREAAGRRYTAAAPPRAARLRPAPASVLRPLPAVNKATRPGRTARPRAPFPSERSLPPSPPSPRSRRHLTAPAASPSTAASSAPRRPTKRRRREASATGHAACFIPPPPPLPSGNSTARLGLPPPRRPLARGAPPGTAAHWGASAALTRHRPSAPSPLAPCGRARP